jgi:thiol-disulfide isomerase/thioredoxin
MFDKSDLSLENISSSYMIGKNYLENMDDQGNRNSYKKMFNNYQPNGEILQKIRIILDKNDEKLTIVAYGATWCPDCRLNIPRLIKIESEFNSTRLKLLIFSKIKTKMPTMRKPGQTIWKSPPSPPEAIDPKFDMKKIPMIYIFKKNGDCLGRIVENPEHTSTLEGDIHHHLEESF